MAHSTDLTHPHSFRPTAGEPADPLGEPTMPPEGAPLLAAAGMQALVAQLGNRHTLGALIVGVLTVALVSVARRAPSMRRA